MTSLSLILGLTLLLLSFVLLFISGRQRRRAGLPGGRVVYTDTRAWGAVEKPLFDPALGLTGKPDYLVEQDGSLIPVEVKTGRTPAAPYDAHIFQVAVYCLLVQKTCGKRPPFGLIHYPGRDFAVDFTPALESALLNLLADIRRDEHRPNVGRTHNDAHRCHRCGFRHACDQKLA
jgi:CRISPR-associated exonuclease Cas4